MDIKRKNESPKGDLKIGTNHYIYLEMKQTKIRHLPLSFFPSLVPLRNSPNAKQILKFFFFFSEERIGFNFCQLIINSVACGRI